MKIVVLCTLLLPSVLATKFGSISAVVTSKDVREGLATNALAPGMKYRVYAVYASSAPNGDYAQNVVIAGADKTQFTVAQLSTPNVATEPFLDGTNILTAPITITDTNAATETRVPYTIYIVSANMQAAPVVSAQRFSGRVLSSVENYVSPSCTVLSAEMSFQLSNFNSDFIDVMNVGFDSVTVDKYNDEYKLLSVNQRNHESSVIISGPIATLHSPTDTSTDFAFDLSRDGAWSGSLSPGVSTALLSNGYLDEMESYNVDYVNDNVLSRSYDFGRETDVYLRPMAPQTTKGQAAVDRVELTCGHADGTAEVYTEFAHTNCKTVSLKVPANNNQGARFMVTIESGAFTTSAIVLLVASIFGMLMH